MIPHSRPTLGRAEAAAASRVILGGQVAEGPKAAAFEIEAARYLGLRAAAAVASGTAALELSLKALGIKDSDEVLIPTYACSALWHAVKRAGAEPVLVDCAAGSDNADMKDAARKRTRKTKAMILVHLFGRPADIKGARALGLPIIEDCAQSLGGRWRGKRLGSFGDACVLSFYATKLITTGEGGMVLSSDRRFIARVRDLREYDEKPGDRVRENAKMTDIQAAMGRVQLGRLESFLRERARLADSYDAALEGIGAELPPSDRGRVYYRYVLKIRGGKRDAVLRGLQRRGVAARVPIYRPLHLDAKGLGRFPNADRAWRESLSLPLYPTLSASEQKRVITAVRASVRLRKKF